MSTLSVRAAAFDDPAAIALDTSSGYERVEPFGRYAWSPTNRCLAKRLPAV